MGFFKRMVWLSWIVWGCLFSFFICVPQALSQQTSPTSTAPKQPGATYEELSVPQAVPVQPTPPGDPTAQPTAESEGLYLNAVDTDIREIIKQIAKATGKNFLIDPKVRGKVTIISEKKMTIEEAYQAFLSSLEVLGYTVVTAPGDLIKIIPMKEALQHPLPIYKEDSPITDAFITRLVQMTNISALDMSSAIKSLVSKQGNLFAYPATNTLILTDTGSNIHRLLKIIKELDQEGPSETIEIVPLRYATAKDIAAKITALYERERGRTPRRRRGRRARRGVELQETPFLSKVIADERTNSVIILASKRAVVKVRQLISRLDRKLEEGAEGKIHVHYLKHSNAKDLAEVLSALTAGVGKRQPTAASRPATGARTPGARRRAAAQPTVSVAEFEGGVRVAADENTNALIITATAKDYKTLAEEVISKLDIPRKQVYVEVVIMELAVNQRRDVGVSGQIAGLFNLGGHSTVGFGTSLGGTAAGLSAATLSGLAAGIISEETNTIPISNSDGSITNFEVPVFGAVLHALQNDSDVNILSTPNLLTLDNEEAEIIVGQNVGFTGGTTVTSGGNETFNVDRQDVGIILKMTPQINEGDMVKIELKQEITSLIPDVSETILTSLGPAITKRSIETVVVAKDQQTIVIGGLIDDQVTVSKEKVPFLGDIPILGHLFKRTQTTKQKRNLLVFLRPYIIRDTKDFLKILQKKVEERNMFVSQGFGKRQQKIIRQSLRNHAADLIEFRKDIQRTEWEFESDTTRKVVPVMTDEFDAEESDPGATSSLGHGDTLLQASQ